MKVKWAEGEQVGLKSRKQLLAQKGNRSSRAISRPLGLWWIPESTSLASTCSSPTFSEVRNWDQVTQVTNPYCLNKEGYLRCCWRNFSVTYQPCNWGLINNSKVQRECMIITVIIHIFWLPSAKLTNQKQQWGHKYWTGKIERDKRERQGERCLLLLTHWFYSTILTLGCFLQIPYI